MRSRYALIVTLFSLSGVSALLYQFVWIRLFSHLLGGTSLAISTVLAAFMGGLAIGSRLFGNRADAVARPLRLYAFLEIGIAVVGGAVPFLILAARPIYVALVADSGVLAVSAVRIGLAAVLVLPATILMGGTLPVLSRHVVRERDRIGRGLGLLYAANTLGAVAGSFLAGFVLIEALGLVACTAAAAGLNLVIGIVMLGLDRRSTDGERAVAGPGPASSPSAPTALGRGLPWLFAASGFAALGYEIHWTRALHHFLGNSTYAYSAMLTTFLLGLSLGGWLGGQLVDRVRARDRLLGWIQIGIAGSVVGTVVLIWGWLPGPSAEALLAPDGMGWKTYLLRRFLVAFAVMIVPTTLLGATFPIVTRLGVDDPARLGHGVGGLYFANTVGAILGSLAAGFLVMPWLGPKAGLLATALLSGTVGVAVFLLRRERRFAESLAAVGAVVLLLVLAIPVERAGAGFLSDTQDRDDLVLFEAEDPIAATRVYQKPNGDRHMSVDGHDIGGSAIGLLRKQKVLAHLPLVLVPEARRVLAVGLGSGITLGTLARYDEVEKLTCVEIVPGVVEGAGLFREFHGDVLADPRVDVLVEDGIPVPADHW